MINLLELIKLMIGTNTQIILKMDASKSKTGPAVELISMGSIGSECKLAGVRTWHRIPFFKNLVKVLF